MEYSNFFDSNAIVHPLIDDRFNFENPTSTYLKKLAILFLGCHGPEVSESHPDPVEIHEIEHTHSNAENQPDNLKITYQLGNSTYAVSAKFIYIPEPTDDEPDFFRNVEFNVNKSIAPSYKLK